ncbi:MAG: carboxypeptidase-like regulatory domain-containing protein, partial [Gemmatimonadota bacterium]|nr:carboxypeptidase-like regulatory domain-containing protein [Gemmatimonadota bacterium]
MRPTRRGRFVLLGASLLGVALPPAAASQQVSGRVVRPGGEHPPPVPGAWVVLHRIAHDRSGPLDSVRTNARGEYTFRYLRLEGDSALYFVSSMRGGVAYFTPPLRAGDVRGEAAEIMVFDTTSAKVPLHVQGRHLVVARGEAGRNHEVLEVYELSNDTSLTAVAPKDGRAVWTAIVPERARRFRVGEGDVGEGGLVMRDGRVHLFAPIAPGLKQLSFRYELSPDAFPLRVPITEAVGVLEIVADGPGARVSGAGLREMRPVQSEGRTFKRFLSQDVPPAAVVRIDLGVERGAARGATVAW